VELRRVDEGGTQLRVQLPIQGPVPLTEAHPRPTGVR
jgi:hypothetical protein